MYMYIFSSILTIDQTIIVSYKYHFKETESGFLAENVTTLLK